MAVDSCAIANRVRTSIRGVPGPTGNMIPEGAVPTFGGGEMVSVSTRRTTMWIIVAAVVLAAVIVAVLLLSGGGGGGGTGGGGGY
jgi:hypothetical protein